ncbi:transcriptional regulator [Actinosynnema sp. ALI-1.44]|uniref:transcriptional regulator n=1 Tax=Actinosynnema sp. ALI-1.44 TaxID=1933779 RepID=UPI00097C9956|nr:transcriptional regulator [Actinosynnema sp. ALI-1.44]ONI84468.1 transcriptional regulator [Actinosynnema sp. ALI-1.44]
MSNSPDKTGSDLLVLHTLRCMGHATIDRIAAALDPSGARMSESDVESELIDLAVAGLVTRSTGEFGGGWNLTGDGRVADADRIAAELDASGARAVITKAFEDFLVLNPELLDLCSAWQMRPVGGTARMNDHTDAAYDSRVLARFTEFHQRAVAVCSVLTSALSRFGRYQIRLGDALAHAEAGRLDYLTDRMDSYHSTWFQLHEDLLTTLGIPRDHQFG